LIIEEKTGAASASPSTFSHDQLTMIQGSSTFSVGREKYN
jgi:hypothetical protein